MTDRVSLGSWFDGRTRRTVDSATWLSPSLLGRWLGYLAERDAWSDTTLSHRWENAQKQIGDNLVFIVRLCAFPRLDPFELGIGAPPKSDSIQGVKFRISIPVSPMKSEPGYVASNGYLIASESPTGFQFEKENWADVLDRPFWSLTPFARLFMSDKQRDEPDDGIPLGDFYGAVYCVRFPLATALHKASGFELAVQLTTKREVAQFTLFEKPKPPPDPSEEN